MYGNNAMLGVLLCQFNSCIRVQFKSLFSFTVLETLNRVLTMLLQRF